MTLHPDNLYTSFGETLSALAFDKIVWLAHADNASLDLSLDESIRARRKTRRAHRARLKRGVAVRFTKKLVDILRGKLDHFVRSQSTGFGERVGFGVRVAWELARVAGGDHLRFRVEMSDQNATDAESCWCGLAFGGFCECEA